MGDKFVDIKTEMSHLQQRTEEGYSVTFCFCNSVNVPRHLPARRGSQLAPTCPQCSVMGLHLGNPWQYQDSSSLAYVLQFKPRKGGFFTVFQTNRRVMLTTFQRTRVITTNEDYFKHINPTVG